MKLVVGLGNPGKNYVKTRHNIGFTVLDALHKKLENDGISNWELSKKFNAKVADIKIKDEKIILAKPMTFMNGSGQTVQLIAHYYKIGVENIVIIHDDKDIKLGEMKVQNERSSAGHNGVQSIIDHLNTNNFTRMRIGVASESERKMNNTAKFVLNRFNLLEKNKVKKIINEATNKIIEIVS